MGGKIQRGKTYVAEDYSALNKQLEFGEISQAEYDAIFTKARKHGLMNTEKGKEIGPIMPFAIGGSDLCIIEGTSKYNTVVGLQQMKLGNKEAEFSDRFYLDYGHIFETAVGQMGIKLYAEEHGEELFYRPCEYGYWCEDAPHFLAHLDGSVVNKEGKVVGIAEVKTTGGSNWDNYFSQGLCPPEYYSQVQAYMYVTKQTVCYLIAYAGFRSKNAFKVIKVELDEKYAKAILEAAEKFVEDTMNGVVYDEQDVCNVDALYSEVASDFREEAEDAEKIALPDSLEKDFETYGALLDEQARLKKEIEEKTKDESDRLSYIEDELKRSKVTFLKAVGDQKGGSFTDKDGNVYTVTVTRGFSKDKESLAYLEENFPDAFKAFSTYKLNDPSVRVSRKAGKKND